MQPLEPTRLHDVRAAAARLTHVALLTPLLRLEAEASAEIHLKLENLQLTGSFKVRGAGNALAMADPDLLARGLSTASAGNMGRAVAWLAHRSGLQATVVVPDDAPAAKLEPIASLGARIVRVTWDQWWQVLVDRRHPSLPGVFVHPFADAVVMAGNGTISLEIVAQLPDVDAVVVPFGGGGLSCAIAATLKELRPDVRVFAAEVATAAPLAASLEAGQPVTVDRMPSFVDGIGGRGMLPEMWPLASSVLDGSILVSVEEVADALRLLATRNRVIAEGAGAAALAAALTGRAGSGRVVAVISGGNIDLTAVSTILEGGMP